MFSWFSPLVVAVVLLAGNAEAWGPKTEEQKKNDRFFKCLLAIEGADVDNDNRISHKEYDEFVSHYSLLLFDEGMSSIPKDLENLYEKLVVDSGAPTGVDLIDVFGAGFYDLANVDEHRIEALHAICEDVAKVINTHGHETEAPLMINLEVLLKEEGGTEEEEEDGDN